MTPFHRSVVQSSNRSSFHRPSCSTMDDTSIELEPYTTEEQQSQEGEDEEEEDEEEEEEEEEAEEEEGQEREEEEEEEEEDGDLKENISAVPDLSTMQHLRDVGKDAICWKLSSAKTGNGVEQIRDQSTDTYWQSDGLQQPHTIQVFFKQRVSISHVCLYMQYSLDESYTPKKVTVSAGVSTQDLYPAVAPPGKKFQFHEPAGWCILPLGTPADTLDDDPMQSLPYARGFVFEICILAMHQSGRDTHIRQVQLYGPRRGETTVATAIPAVARNRDPEIPTSEENTRHTDDPHGEPSWELAALQLQTPFSIIR